MIATPAPELGKNENILFEVPKIEIKSIEFRLYLTNRRIFLAEDKTRLSSPIDIPLPVISSIKTGQTPSDEPTLILSIRAPDGSQKRMTLIFSQDFSGLRNMERDYLKKELEGMISEYVPSSIPHIPAPPKEVLTPAPGFQEPQERHFTPGAVGSDSVLLQAHNIIVKSQEFTINLTRNELTLTDPNHPNKPASISLKSVRNVEKSTNPQNEPVMGLHAESPNGEMRTMNLTFSHWHKGDRWNERDTWVGAISDIIATGGRISSIPGLGYQAPAEPKTESRRYPSGGAAAEFSAHPPGERYCSECGNPVSPGAKFCPECGAPADSYGQGMNDGAIIDADDDDDFLFPQKPVRTEGRKKVRTKRPPRRRRPERRPRKERVSRDPLGLGGGASYQPDGSVIGRFVGFIRAPAETFRITRDEDLTEALPVMALALAIFAIITGIIFQLYAASLDTSTYPEMTALKEMGTLLFFIIEVIVLGILYAVFNGILIHVGLLITGYGEDLLKDIRIAAYSLCPFAVAAVIPLFGLIIAPFWAFFLQFIGIRETYNLEPGKAAMAAAVPVVVIFLLLLFFIGQGDSGFQIFGGA